MVWQLIMKDIQYIAGRGWLFYASVPYQCEDTIGRCVRKLNKFLPANAIWHKFCKAFPLGAERRECKEEDKAEGEGSMNANAEMVVNMRNSKWNLMRKFSQKMIENVRIGKVEVVNAGTVNAGTVNAGIVKAGAVVAVLALCVSAGAASASSRIPGGSPAKVMARSEPSAPPVPMDGVLAFPGDGIEAGEDVLAFPSDGRVLLDEEGILAFPGDGIELPSRFQDDDEDDILAFPSDNVSVPDFHSNDDEASDILAFPSDGYEGAE